MESSSLWDLVSASSTEIGHLVSTIVCFITQNPFDSLAKVVLASTGLPRGYLTVRTGRSKVNASFARIPDAGSILGKSEVTQLYPRARFPQDMGHHISRLLTLWCHDQPRGTS
jgi:hypothetical protein